MMIRFIFLISIEFRSAGDIEHVSRFEWNGSYRRRSYFLDKNKTMAISSRHSKFESNGWKLVY